MKGFTFSKGDSLCCHKNKILFSSSFWGIFDFFCLFQYFERLKKNKRMLCYKGGTSVTCKQTSSKHMENIDAQCKETCIG